MKTLIPVNCAKLVECAEKDGGSRWAMACVRARLGGETYRLDVTNGKVLVVVEGEAEKADDYPMGQAASDSMAKLDQAEAMIPVKAWKDAFAKAQKVARRCKRGKPVFGNVVVAAGKDTAALYSTDLEEQNQAETRLVDGRYPAVDEVFPKDKTPVAAKVRLTIEQLKRALAVAESFGDTVELTVYRQEKAKDGELVTMPVGFVVPDAPAGQRVRGLIMPCG